MNDISPNEPDSTNTLTRILVVSLLYIFILLIFLCLHEDFRRVFETNASVERPDQMRKEQAYSNCKTGTKVDVYALSFHVIHFIISCEITIRKACVPTCI